MSKNDEIKKHLNLISHNLDILDEEDNGVVYICVSTMRKSLAALTAALGGDDE